MTTIREMAEQRLRDYWKDDDSKYNDSMAMTVDGSDSGGPLARGADKGKARGHQYPRADSEAVNRLASAVLSGRRDGAMKRIPKPLGSGPLRRCQSMHECAACHRTIMLGQQYYDGGYGRRVHYDCVKRKADQEREP